MPHESNIHDRARRLFAVKRQPTVEVSPLQKCRSMKASLSIRIRKQWSNWNTCRRVVSEKGYALAPQKAVAAADFDVHGTCALRARGGPWQLVTA